jgi:single-stranded-DNA-specific exonuclease
MKWVKKAVEPEMVKELHERYGIDALTASILARRGITEGEEVLFYLEDDPRYLHSPFLFKDMEDAVDRILNAVEEGEKVLIFGDRDVDGITGAVLLSEALTELGLEPQCRLPCGEEPYGLSRVAVEEFAKQDGTLIITVDNGISCFEEIELAGELGIDVIIVDHHNPGESKPDALAIINPKCEDSGYPFRDLAGCAVAYKLAQALRFSQSSLYKQQVCLLNVRPLNDTLAVEAVKLSNMIPVKRISEFLVPGAVDLSRTRLIPFLRDQHIMVWDAQLQKKLLAKAFGDGVEISMLDAAIEVGEAMPKLRGQSLLRLRELSRIAKYRPADADSDGELATFESIFISYIQRKAKAFSEADADDLQLVALGTIADMMPLTNENRILVKRGLKSLRERPRRGAAELLYSLGLLKARSASPLTAKEISWQVTPVINASGRMGDPTVALKLFTAKDGAERERLAAKLIGMNDERKQLGTDAWDEILPQAEASKKDFSDKLIVVLKEDLHRGITGIMASKLAKAFNLPSVVMTRMGDSTLVGSMRSLRGFDARSFLDAFSDLLIDFGGHDFAAGFSLKAENYPEFRERLIYRSADVELEPLAAEETLNVDAEIPRAYLKPDLIEVPERFEPVGEDCAPLIFMARDLTVNRLEIIGKKEPFHLRLELDSGQNKWPAVFWQAAKRAEDDIVKGAKLDVVFNLGRDGYNGADTPRMVLLDARKAGQAEALQQ